MSDESQQAPCKKDPAPQPKDPTGNCKPPDADPKAPTTLDPEPCETCCDCPSPPGGTPTCFDTLIAKEASTAAQAESAKAFKTELEDLQKKAILAKADYTTDKYNELLDRWKKQDVAIVGLIKKIVCAVPCWRCVLECLVCPLLHAVRNTEIKLYGDRKPYPDVRSLLDERYWWQRERERRAYVFDRIKKTMTAWENPGKSIDKVLNDNATLIGATGITPKDLYDVFLKIVPMHLAIAPPASVATTAIEKRFVDLCECGTPPDADDCCGPNVGERTVRQRLNDVQASLLTPDKYLELICCLLTTRYQPAKESLAQADSELAAAEARVTRATVDIAAKLTSLPADAKAALSVTIDCEQFKGKGNGGGGCDDDNGDTKQTPNNPASSY